MSDRDRIIALERQVRELTRQVAHLPARWGEGSADFEKFRLIRGESVGGQSGGTILIDNVDVLAGGLDPSGGDPGVQVTVQNIFGQSYTDNEPVQAIYNEDLGGTDLTDWEAIKTSSGTETYRAIRGLAIGDIVASAVTFTIDNVIPLAGGLDPSGGNPATPITVQNIQGEAFADDEPITAIYDGAAWEVLLVERFRLINGSVAASVTADNPIFDVDSVTPLADGLSPVTDPLDVVSVAKSQQEALQHTAPITAAWNGTSWDLLNTERYRLVRGQVFGSVSAGTTVFEIDNIEVLSSGVDPRLDPTDAAELLLVSNFHDDDYEDDEWVIAAFKEDTGGPGIDWEALKKPTNERFRLIRGQSVGVQSGATILIDNVDVLAGGLDPTNGNATTQITVWNIFGQSYNDNEPVQAIYNEGLGGGDTSDWEAIKTSSGTETYRAIRGLTKGAVAASAATFIIDNVVPLASSNDPVSGNAATEITVQNKPDGTTQKASFPDNWPITAIYDGANWELLITDRFYMIRGQAVGAVSGSGSFNIDNIVPLEFSLDPRSDPTSASETVSVDNFHTDSYADNEWVTAVFKVSGNNWEALKKSATASAQTIAVKLAGGSTISARSGTTRGSGTVQPVNETTLANDGGTITAYNLSERHYEAPSGDDLYLMANLVGSDYFIQSFETRSINGWITDNNQSLGHDAGELDEWQDDTEC